MKSGLKGVLQAKKWCHTAVVPPGCAGLAPSEVAASGSMVRGVACVDTL